MKPQPLGAGRRSVFGRTEKSYQALVDAACPGPVDRPHRANINRKKLYWGRWDHARRSIADNRWHGKVRCDPDITYEQAAGRGLENCLCQGIDSPPNHRDWWLIPLIDRVIILKTPVVGFFVLWLSAGLLAGLTRDAQRKNIRQYRRGLAPFHFRHAPRPDEREEVRLIKLYQAGDVIAGNMIIAAHIWIAKDGASKIWIANDVASKYPGQVERDDLIQEGTFGLYKALQKFDPDRTIPGSEPPRSYRFSTLAYRAVECRIKDYLEKLRKLQRHESADELTEKGASAVLGLYREISVEPQIFFD